MATAPHKPSGTVIVIFAGGSRFGRGVQGKEREEQGEELQDAYTQLSFGNRIVPSQIRYGPPGMSAIFK